MAMPGWWPAWNGVQQSLDIPIVDSPFISLDLWSIGHFLSGFVVMFLILKYGFVKRQRYLYLLMLLAAYEVLEFMVYSVPYSFLSLEPATDTFWDIIIGMAGGTFYDWLAYSKYYHPRKHKEKNKR